MNTTALIVFLAVVLVAMCVVWFFGRHHKHEGFTNLFQGFAAIATVIALIVAAFLYVEERKDRAKLGLEIRTLAIPVQGKDGRRAILFQVSAKTNNFGFRTVTAECINLDIAGLPANLKEVSYARPEFQLASLIPADTSSDRWKRCAITQDGGRTGFYWGPSTLEPGSSDTSYYELEVPCTFRAVRTLIKIRRPSEPGKADNYKLLSPISDVCAGKRSYMTAGTGSEARSD